MGGREYTAVPRANHRFRDGFAAEDRAEEVCVEDFLGDGGGGREEEGAVRDAGGVDEDCGGCLEGEGRKGSVGLVGFWDWVGKKASKQAGRQDVWFGYIGL